jgi:hypothetical protein
MALRLRRGLDIERHSVIFAEGEPLYTTDTKQIYIGDGATPGGLLVSGLLSLSDDETPRLGGSIDLNSHDIIGAGNVNIVGDLTITGAINAGFIDADYRGSIFGNDSSVIVDGNINTIHGSTVSENDTILVNVTTGEINLNSTLLSSLQDVDNYGNSVGEVLTWNGSAWIGQLFGGGTPTANALLQYDAALGYVSATQIKGTNGQSLVDVTANTINITNQNLEELANVYVDNSTIVADDILTYDGANWTHKQLTLTNFNITLDDLDDVIITAPAPNDVLSWNGTDWTSRPILLDDLNNVYAPTANPNDVLTWDGTSWVANTPSLVPNSLDDLDDVFLANANINDVLTYNGTNWVANTPSLVANSLDDLDDVFIGSATNGNLLTYDGNSWTAQPFTALLNDIDDIFIDANLQVKDVLTWNGYHWTNEPLAGIEDTFQGSVYGLDSTVIVDGTTNSITSDSITSNTLVTGVATITEVNASENRFSISGPSGSPFQLVAIADEDHATIKCIKSSVNDLSSDTELNGRILFSRYDTTNGEISTGGIFSTNEFIRLCSSAGGTFLEQETLQLINTGGAIKVGIGTFTPAETLHVAGSGKYDSFVQFGSLSTVERDALTPANGMVIYNTTVDKFQGYAGGAWVDLS